jgi:uncharacterized protein (TIGR04141 family)
MHGRAYLMKQCPRDEDGRPTALLADGAGFVEPADDAPDGIWLATRPGEENEPSWSTLVRAAAGEDLDLEARTAPGAALIVEVDEGGDLVSFCFGSGRFLLRRSSYVLGFGMRAALNAAVRSGAEAVASISWVSFRTTDADPVDGRLRASVPKDLGGYGVTPGLDRMRGVRVQHLEGVGVGRSLEGSTSLGVVVPDELRDLTNLATRLADLGWSDDFRDTWPHVDDLIAVEDHEERELLDEKLQARLSNGELDGVFVGVPDEAEDHSSVSYGASEELHEDFDLSDALSGWRGNIKSLRSRRVIFHFDDGRPPHTESLYDLLVATQVLDGEEVHLTDGGWFRVRAELLEIIDNSLDGINEWEVALPEWLDQKSEGEYLLDVAAGSPDLLLMDRKNVLVGGGNAMEVCDLAHVDGAMVHVKKRDTKGLSHLAAQILASATRWSRDYSYRDAVFVRIAQQADVTDKPAGPFEAAFDPALPRQGSHPQVIAIGAGWAGRPLSEVMTTLAKVQMHRTCMELRSRGFEISVAKIERHE